MPGQQLDLSALEKQYNLPPGILAATIHVESRGRDVTSPAGAQGIAQLMPATAKALNADPHNPFQAADAAARLWRQNLDAAHGDIDLAARMYHGGPDRSRWGAANAAYPGQILAALQGGAADTPAPQGKAPIDDYLSQASGGQTGAPIDDYISQAVGGNTAGDASNPSAPVSGVPDRSGDQGNSHNRGVSGSGGAVGGGGAGQGGVFEKGLATSADIAGGFAHGITAPADSLNAGIGWLADKLGASQSTVDRAREFAQQHAFGAGPMNALVQALIARQPTNETARNTGDFAGEMAALAPLGELSLFGKASKHARAGNYMLQGGLGGALTSRGEDVGARTAIGAITGPIAGLGIEAIAPLAMKGLEAVGNSKLANAIRSRISGAVDAGADLGADAAPQAAAMNPDKNAQIADMIRKGVAPEDIVSAFPDYVQHPDELKAWQDYYAKGGKEQVSFTPGTVPKDQLAAAIGNRAAKRSILANQDLPPEVAARRDELVKQGVPDAEALRQADIEGVGASPDVASVRRSPEDMRARNNASQLSTPEGTALAQQVADNNAAIHSTAQGLVEANGGVIAPGDAVTSASESLKAASAAERKGVNAKYKAAREADPEALITPDSLRELVNSDEAKQLVPGTPEHSLVQQVKNTIEGTSSGSGIAPKGMTPEAIDNISQVVNRKYGPDKAVNYWAKKVSEATGTDLDQLDGMGDLWREARAAHRSWAEKYQDPTGVRKAIANDGNWGTVEKNLLSGGMKESEFLHVVDRLKKNGDTETLGKLKSAVLQTAYEAAGGKGAADLGANQTFSGQRWADAIDKFGDKRLQALFSPEELASIAHVGRAALHLNESIPGTLNTSGTGQMVLEALAKQGKGLPNAIKWPIHIGAQGIELATHGIAPGAGNVVAGVVSNAATKGADSLIASRNSAKLAKAVQEFMSPDAARAAEAERLAAAQDAERRARLAQIIASRSAPAAGNNRSIH